ncbi:hypothetical protein HK096_010277, partial [Nowakowskiella sp. JEL0078]
MERFSVARHNKKYFACVCLSARLNVEIKSTLKLPTLDLEFIKRIENSAKSAVDLLIQKYPCIRMSVFSAILSPYFQEVNSTKLPLEFTVATEENKEYWRKIMQNEVNQFFELAVGYLWRIKFIITKIFDSCWQIDIIFSIHHSIADGLSSHQILKDYCSYFTKIFISANSKSIEIEPVLTNETLENLVPSMVPNTFTLVKFVLNSILEILGVSHSGYQLKKPPTFDNDSMPVQIIPARIEDVSRIHRACVANGTTVHALLCSCLQNAAARVLDLPSGSTVDFSHSVSTRPLHPQHNIGVYVQQVKTFSKLPLLNIWDTAVSIKKQMGENQHNGLMVTGMLGLASDTPGWTLESWLEKKIANEHGSIVGCSNLGLQDWSEVEKNVDPEFEITIKDVWFNASLGPEGNVMMLNVIGMKGSDLF